MPRGPTELWFLIAGRALAASLLLVPQMLPAQTPVRTEAPAAQPAAGPDSTGDPDDPDDPDKGLATDDMPDIGIDWPDLTAPSTPIPVEPDEPDGTTAPAGDGQPGTGEDALQADLASPEPEEADALTMIDPGASLRYVVSIDGLGDASDATLLSRFDNLSVLKEGEGARANLAQIRRRGQTDTDLLTELMRARGFYDARTRFTMRALGGGSDPQIGAVLGANPGQRYLLDAVNVLGLSETSPLGLPLPTLFTVKAGDPADTDAILAATDKLRVGLGENGYPFADVGDPVLTVDHQQREAILNISVTTGGFRRFGEIRVNDTAPFSARHVGVIARFSPGEPYNQSDITDLNRALVATGLVGQVTITPQEGKDDQTVDLAIAMTPAPPRTIAGEIGYGTGEGARIQASWQHRNFFPPEGAMTFRGVLGTQEQSLSAVLRRANFRKRDQVLNGELMIANVDQPAYQALTAGIAASIERQTNLIFQKAWIWSLGTELRISDERDLYGETLIPRHRTYVIAALPASITYDGSDDLLDPRRGFRLGARLSPEVSLQHSVFTYVRAQMDGSAYLPMGERFTLAGRVRLGTIVGADADRIAPTRRFYAGGGASVRGYAYQAIGPRDLNNDPTGGRSLGEVSVELRYRFGSMNQFGIVPFVDAGTISADMLPSIREMRVGAGLGLRYYSSFGPIRIDVGTPINPQAGDPRIGVYVSLGQAF